MKFLLTVYADPAVAVTPPGAERKFVAAAHARQIAPTPMATLNQAIAVAMTDGPEAGLAMVSALAADDRMARHHRLTATRAHLLELAGDTAAARQNYLLAARRATSMPEQRYLRARADRLVNVDPTA